MQMVAINTKTDAKKKQINNRKTARLILYHSLFPRAPWMLIPVKQKAIQLFQFWKKQTNTHTQKDKNLYFHSSGKCRFIRRVR